MDLEVSIHKHAAYYRIVVTGDASFDRLVALVHVLGVDSQDWPVTRIAFDLRGLRTVLARSDRYRAGLELGGSFAHMEKVAVVVSPGRLTGTGAGVARRNGLNAQSFNEVRLALDWLLQEAPAAD